eukprot:3166600-Pyramimonas_sp.AAC.1
MSWLCVDLRTESVESVAVFQACGSGLCVENPSPGGGVAHRWGVGARVSQAKISSGCRCVVLCYVWHVR